MKRVVKSVLSLFLATMVVLGAVPLSGLIDLDLFDYELKANAAISDIEIKNYKGHSYAVIDLCMDWYSAKDYCENLGGHLVTITSAEEQKFITDLLAGKLMNCYWMGGFESEDKEWLWVTGEEFSYNNWKYDEPNNEGDEEDYLEIYSKTYERIKVGQWNDIMYDGRNGKLNKNFYSTSTTGLICEWDYKEKYNKIVKQMELLDKINITVMAESTDTGRIEPVRGATVEICCLGDVIDSKKTNGDGTVTFKKSNIGGEHISNEALDYLTVKAYKYVGNEIYAVSDLDNPYTLGYFTSVSDTITLTDAQFRPTLSVAVNTKNHSLDYVKGVLDDYISDFYTLTGKKTLITISKIEEHKSDFSVSRSNCNILIKNKQTNQADTGGYKKNGTHIYMGFVNDNYGFASNLLCHETMHYLFGVRDEYCCGYRVKNNNYGIDFNGNGKIDDTYYWVYWASDASYKIKDSIELKSNTYLTKKYNEIDQELSSWDKSREDENSKLYYIFKVENDMNPCPNDSGNIVNLGKVYEPHGSYWATDKYYGVYNHPLISGDFGIMDKNTLSMSYSFDYDYLDDYSSTAKDNVDKNNPQWYTAQYYQYGCSVAEQVQNKLEDRVPGAYSYVLDCAANVENLSHYILSANSDYNVEQIEEIYADDDNTRLLESANIADNSLCNASFSAEPDYLNVFLSSAELSNATLLVKYAETDALERFDLTFADGKASAQIFTEEKVINDIFVLAESSEGVYEYNKYIYETFSDELSDGSHASSSGSVSMYTAYSANMSVVSDNIKYTYGDYSSIDNAFNTVITESTEEVITGTFTQHIPYSTKIDFSSAQAYIFDGENYTAIETIVGSGESAGYAYISFPFTGEGKYILMAKAPADTVYEAPTNLLIDDVGSTYEKEIHVSFEDSNNPLDIVAYELYYSTSEITDTSAEGVMVETLKPDDGSYTLYLNDEYGDYYFYVEALGKDGGKSPLSEPYHFSLAPYDSDADGLPDYWIKWYPALSELEDIPGTDTDDDGLTNLLEYQNGTNPLNPDTDGDNVYDSIELWNDLNPLEPMTDGVIDDYTIIYGTPDVGIDVSTFVVGKTEVTCSIENNTDGKAMRTAIYLYIGDELVDAGTVNLDSNSSVEYSFSKEYLVDGMRIVLDEGQITRDTDYSNNEFAYVSATGVTADNADVVIAKGTSTQLEYSLTPENATDILLWETADSKIITVSNRGVAIAGTIGTTTVTATTPTGYSCTYNILVEPFPGAGQTDFDCQLINDNTELEIIGYYGSDSDIAIPDSIGGYPVTSIADGAFSGCEFESVVINDGINNIGLSAFNEADNLKSIEVNEENTAYCSVDGVLYNTDKTVLIRYPVASENTGFVVMDAVTMIEKNAFNGTVGLSSIDIPESITEIKSNSFVNTALTIVNYAGSQRMWESLVIANDSGLSEKTICYGKFTATFISEGETISETDYSPGEPIVIPDSAPEKKYYTFVDWTPEVPDAMPECDTIFIPEWTIADNTRTVEFYSDGELYWSDYRYAGEAVNTPEAIPTKEGYTFVKWSPDVAQIMPDEDLQYEAVWDVNIHNVSFLVDGKEYHAYERAYSESVTIPSPPEKEGYVFAGWTPSIPETMPDTELSFTAVFDPIVYTATFTYGETVLGTDEFTLDDIVLDYPAVAEKAGYDWVWEEHAIIPEDITVNGDYSIINYTATFVADGETVESVSFTVENQTVVAPEIPHKDGYTYEWENYEVSLADFTVNAVYTPIIYTATFTSDGEIIGTDEFTVEDASLDYPSMEKVEHYDWVWDEHSIQANDITVDGGYAPTIYTATFIANGETVSVQQFSVEDKTVISPEIPPREGYTSNWQDYQIELVDFTVNAVYTPIKYKATFVDGDKWIGEDYFTVEDMELDYPPSPIKQYYEWNWDPVTVTLSDITVTGYFSPVTYTATFVSNGKTVKTQKFTVENYETVCAPTCTLPQKSGYTRGWEKYEGIIGNITVNEIYLPNNYTAYCYCEGELIETRTFTVETPEERFLYPTVPGRLGYTVEWTAFKAVPRNINLYAEYVPIEYTAQFVVDGDVISTQKFTVETVSLNEPSIPPKAGFVSQWSYYRISVGDKTIIPVYYYPEVITLSRRTLYVGDTTELVFSSNFEETKKVWSSSDNSVATVDKSGKVTAKGEGKCNVTVTCYGKDSAGNDIEASSSTTIIVKEKTQPKTFKQQFREAFNEFFQVKLHDIIHNFKDFMFALVRYTR